MPETEIELAIREAAARGPEGLPLLEAAGRRWPREVAVQLAWVRVLCSAQRWEEALRVGHQALRARPDAAELHAELAALLEKGGRRDKAIAAWEAALRLDGAQSAWWCALGEQYGRSQRFHAAREAFQKAAQLEPARGEAWSGMGRAYEYLGQTGLAEQMYRESARRAPQHAEAWHQLAVLIGKAGRLEEAHALLVRAAELAPRDRSVLHNLGMVTGRLQRFAEAEAIYRRAVLLEPPVAESWHRLGWMLYQQQRFSEALESFDRALAVEPGSLKARADRSLVYLLSGDLRRGFADYEYRKSAENFPKPAWSYASALARWNGAPLPGEKILLHGEQGLGDVIQFLRYVPLVAERGLQCTVEVVSESLRRLARTVAGVERVIVRGERAEECRWECSLLSLPFVFQTTLETIPAQAPYLRVDDATRSKWTALTGPRDGRLRVGAVWQGSPTHSNDARRSIPAELFDSLAGVKGIAWYSLQKETRGQRPAALAPIDLMHEVTDFLDTAGLLEQLDLVISVDTSVVHLAGALARPVWMLLPWHPDWRWLIGRDDSPWYPTMRLFRQTKAGDWQAVMARVRVALEQRVAHTS